MLSSSYFKHHSVLIRYPCIHCELGIPPWLVCSSNIHHFMPLGTYFFIVARDSMAGLFLAYKACHGWVILNINPCLLGTHVSTAAWESIAGYFLAWKSCYPMFWVTAVFMAWDPMVGWFLDIKSCYIMFESWQSVFLLFCRSIVYFAIFHCSYQSFHLLRAKVW